MKGWPRIWLLLFGAGAAAATAADGPDRLLRQRAAGVLRPLPSGGAPPRRGRPAGARAAGVDSVIQPDFVCNDDTSGGSPQQEPSIAVFRDGSAVAFWHEFRDGDADVWFQRLDTAGSPIGPNQRVNDDVTLGWQGSPAVAVGADGRFVATWEDRREIGNSDVFSQWFDAAGGRAGPNLRISDSVAGGDQDISGVSIGPDGQALVVWDDRRFGLTGDIFGQFLNPDGSVRDTNFRINDDGVGYANQYEPSVAGDDSGRFVAVWMDGRGHNPYDWNVFGQRFAPSGQRLGSNFQVTSDDSIQWSPDAACGPAGEFVVCWDDRRPGGQYDVYAQRYDAQGHAAGGNFRVNDDAGARDQFAPAAAVNRYGEFMLVWADERTGAGDIHGRLYNPDGSAQGASLRLNDDAGAADQLAPDVAARPDGGFEVVWIDCRDGDADIYGQRCSRDGAPIGPNRRLNDDRASSQQRVSSIGMNADGRICVVWEDERNVDTDVYRAMLDEDGRPLSANLRLNSDSPGSAQYYAAVAGGRDRFVAAWTDFRAGPQSGSIYARYMDADGQVLGPDFRVSSDSGAFQWYPYCALDSSDRASLVWMDYRNGSPQVFGRRFDRWGTPVGSEFAVSDTAVEGDYASVATNRSGRFVVAWMDSRNRAAMQFDVYCQAFRSDGSRVGRNIRVNADSGNTYQGYPACAVDEQGRFAVAWEDTREGCYQVYSQWFDSAGARLGGNDRVGDGPTGSDCYSPTCAFSPAGLLAVGFNDEREAAGNPEFYCQRFRPDRTRISNNQRVNEPDGFPNDHHWTVGQSIAASADRLAFAWTGNRRHQGWDIVAKVTDWNLVGIAVPPAARPNRARPLVHVVERRRVRVRSAAGSAVRVFDAAGRCVLVGQEPGAVGDVEFVVPNAGVYFLTTSGSTDAATKLVME